LVGWLRGDWWIAERHAACAEQGYCILFGLVVPWGASGSPDVGKAAAAAAALLSCTPTC
jgi:hypothetical protein